MIEKVGRISDAVALCPDLKRWKGFVIHHTFDPDGLDGRPEIDIIKSIDRSHLLGWKYNEKGIWKVRPGWINGLGYHFVIGLTGSIYIGKRWIKQTRGAHCPGYNDWIGVSFLGDYDGMELRKKSRDAFAQLVKELKGGSRRRVLHREVRNTECPGKNITEALIDDIFMEVRK